MRDLFPFLPRRLSPGSFFTGFLLALLSVWIVNHLHLLHSSSTSPPPPLLLFDKEKKEKLAVFFGDSITQHAFNPQLDGWVAAVAHYFARKAVVVNRGLSGYNSRFARAVFDEAVGPLRPDLLILFFGANDATVPSHVTSVTVDDFQHNLESMLIAARTSNPSLAVVLITPPPVWEAALEAANAAKHKAIVKDRTNDRTRQYADAVLAVGAKHAAPVVDAFAGMEGTSTNRQLYLADGLHLNARGNQRLFELFTEVVEGQLKGWATTSLPLRFPSWEAMVAMKKA